MTRHLTPLLARLLSVLLSPSLVCAIHDTRFPLSIFMPTFSCSLWPWLTLLSCIVSFPDLCNVSPSAFSYISLNSSSVFPHPACPTYTPVTFQFFLICFFPCLCCLPSQCILIVYNIPCLALHYSPLPSFTHTQPCQSQPGSILSTCHTVLS